MRHFSLFLLCTVFAIGIKSEITMEGERCCECQQRSKARLGALDPDTTAFFQVDVQETFRPQANTFDEVVRTSYTMIEAGKLLNIPVFASEHIGYGPTSKGVENLKNATMIVQKLTFSMYTPEVRQRLKKEVPNVKTVVLYGVVTHICVEQTAIDLIADGIVVHVLAEGVSAGTKLENDLALQRLQSMGCFITTFENIMYKLVKRTDHPKHDSIPLIMLAGNSLKL